MRKQMTPVSKENWERDGSNCKIVYFTRAQKQGEKSEGKIVLVMDCLFFDVIYTVSIKNFILTGIDI